MHTHLFYEHNSAHASFKDAHICYSAHIQCKPPPVNLCFVCNKCVTVEAPWRVVSWWDLSETYDPYFTPLPSVPPTLFRLAFPLCPYLFLSLPRSQPLSTHRSSSLSWGSGNWKFLATLVCLHLLKPSNVHSRAHSHSRRFGCRVRQT